MILLHTASEQKLEEGRQGRPNWEVGTRFLPGILGVLALAGKPHSKIQATIAQQGPFDLARFVGLLGVTN